MELINSVVLKSDRQIRKNTDASANRRFIYQQQKQRGSKIQTAGWLQNRKVFSPTSQSRPSNNSKLNEKGSVDKSPKKSVENDRLAQTQPTGSMYMRVVASEDCNE
jgi:hypothetical protein